ETCMSCQTHPFAAADAVLAETPPRTAGTAAGRAGPEQPAGVAAQAANWSDVLARLDRLEALLLVLVERETVKDWYTTEEVAKLLGKAEFTVREWCRLGRIRAEKRKSGRGAHPAWVVSHDELQRYRREGLLPQC